MRLEKTIMNNFVTDFDRMYVEQIITTSLKPAVAGILNKSENISKDGLVSIMDGLTTGYMDSTLTLQSNLRRVLGTLTFSLDNPDKILNVTLKKVEQNEPFVLKFTFDADYRFELNGNVWEKKGKEIVIYMDIYSLKHPSYNYNYIEHDWIRNLNATKCFSNQVFTDAEPCFPYYNVEPLQSMDQT